MQKQPNTQHTQHTQKGIYFLLLGEFFFSAMAATIKAIDADTPNTLIVFWRNAFGFLCLLPFVFFTLKSGHFGSHIPLATRFVGHALYQTVLKTKCLRYHILRASSGLCAMYGFFYIIRHIPLAEATLVKMTAPFFLPIVGFIWLNDKIPRNTLMGIIIGFIGVIFILKPGSDEFSPIALWGLIAALLASIAKVTIRKMGCTEPTLRIVLYFAFFSCILSLIPALSNWQPLSKTTWFWMLLSGALGTLGQITMTQAYRIASPGKIGLFTYATVIYASILGWLFWEEALSIYTLIGTAFIVCAGIISTAHRTFQST